MSEGHGFVFVLDEELSEDDLVALVVTTPAGQTVQIWAEVELIGRTATLRQFAIYGVDVSAKELGLAALRAMARAAMEDFDVDCIRIEEARRTSGANPGRTARSIEFRRRAR
ncbi:MAG: hypothetical protein AB7S71_10960 [Dongiaceae bacterium]